MLVVVVSSFIGFDWILVGLYFIYWEKDLLLEDMIIVLVVLGVVMMMWCDVFEKLGGFDECYFLYVEDIDLCRILCEKGGEVWFELCVNIFYYGGISESSLWKVEIYKVFGFVKYFWKFYLGLL